MAEKKTSTGSGEVAAGAAVALEAADSGAGYTEAAISRNLAEVTNEEMMEMMSYLPDPTPPPFLAPVSEAEFERLLEYANQPDTVMMEAALDTTSADQDIEAAAMFVEAPEGETVAAPIAAAPAINASFEGIPQTAFRPPDCTQAVGPNNVLVAVNSTLASYTKTGALQFTRPLLGIGGLFNAVLPADARVFDPRVAYDHYAQRYIVTAAARHDATGRAWFAVAVTQTPSPTGAYWVWALDARLNGSTLTSFWGDYPMLGFDTQAVYISANMFTFPPGNVFQYAKLRILKKAQLYAGAALTWYDFWNLTNPDGSKAFTVQPAVHFRGLGGNPPAYLVNALFPSGNKLTRWTLTNPVAAVPTLSRVSVNCLAYELPPSAQQLGTGALIATNDDRLLNAIYQNVGGTQRLWTCHTTKHTWSGEAAARSVVQWYEINVPTNAVVQQNRYGAPGAYYFFPAIQTDIRRNAYLVFGRSSAAQFAQLRQTGRLVAAPLNDLQNSALIMAGVSSYTGGRWGDYFGVCRDGGDANKVWMCGEYAGPGNTWRTRIAGTNF